MITNTIFIVSMIFWMQFWMFWSYDAMNSADSYTFSHPIGWSLDSRSYKIESISSSDSRQNSYSSKVITNRAVSDQSVLCTGAVLLFVVYCEFVSRSRRDFIENSSQIIYLAGHFGLISSYYFKSLYCKYFKVLVIGTPPVALEMQYCSCLHKTKTSPFWSRSGNDCTIL